MSDHEIDHIVAHRPMPFVEAVQLAVRRTGAEAVVTRWSDAGYTSADTIPGEPGLGRRIDARRRTVRRDDGRHEADLSEAFARIGGANGYYVTDWAWHVRGLMDRCDRRTGLRRGRRPPDRPPPG